MSVCVCCGGYVPWEGCYLDVLDIPKDQTFEEYLADLVKNFVCKAVRSENE